MPTEIALFTRDLRVRDNPQLHAAARADFTVPLFVVDEAMIAGRHSAPNRLAFLVASLDDLDASLRERGAPLVTRRGNWVRNVVAVARTAAAARVHVMDDVSAAATTRLAALEAALEAALGGSCELVRHPGAMVIPAGAVTPAGGGEFKVFTPYYRRWLEVPWRAVVPTPKRIVVPSDLEAGPRPALGELTGRATSAAVTNGGESAGTERLKRWTRSTLARYDDIHNDLAGDDTSRISPYLHLGCLSPLEVATRLRGRDGAAPFVRQLCWRDFYHQVLAARPDSARADYRDRGDAWIDDPTAFAAWCEGRTGFPIVDAGMRQLQAEGFVHNRARMIVASFLTKDLGIDWRRGAAHFMEWLVDGDVACNQLNWQWVAGTGTDSNPNRIFNPTVQSRRFDPSGEYIRRYVAELRSYDGDIHDPPPLDRAACHYPSALVDHREAIAGYRARRGS